MGQEASAPADTGARRLRVTLVHSAIGYRESQRLTVKSLGLRRVHQSVEHYDNPTIRGMINKVSHLVQVEEVPDDGAPPRADTGAKRFKRRMAKKVEERNALLAELGLLDGNEDEAAASE